LSGDWIATDLPQRLWQLFPKLDVMSLGGATEAAIWSIDYHLEPGHIFTTSIPYGRPLSNQHIYVYNQQMSHCPAWVVGDIYIGGEGLAQGYWQDVEKTNAAFITHPFTKERLYKTGDLGRFTPDGVVEFLGREDGQVKLQGYRIELGEIESTIMQFAGVMHVAVTVTSYQQTHYLVAYIVGDVAIERINTYLESQLPSYMVPQFYQTIAELPLSVNGKVNKQALPNIDIAVQLSKQYVSPQSELELAVTKVWSELTGHERIGRDDRFFTVGGDSLVATRLVAKLQQQFSVPLTLLLFFQNDTVGTLCEWIQSQDGGAEVEQAKWLQITPDPDNVNAPFVLNDIQQAYWLGRQGAFELGGVACHFYFETISDNLDLVRLEKAWNRLIQRHDMLRAVIHTDGMQQILDTVPTYEFTLHDFTALTIEQQQAGCLDVRESLAHQQMATDQWPVFDIHASQLSQGGLRLHFSFDFLVADVWSFLILFKEWQQLYEQPEVSLAPLSLSFRDYVLAEKQLQSEAAEQVHWQYWLDRIPSIPTGPDLPLAKSPSLIEQPHFVRHTHQFSRVEWSSLKHSAAELGVSPSMILCSAYVEILALWSRQKHFSINLTLFNRLPLHDEVENIVGDFTTLTLLERHVNTANTFAERTLLLQQQLHEDLEHRQINGIRVLREYQRHHQLGSQAAIPVVFTSALPLKDQHEAENFPLSWLGERTYSISQTPQVWMDHHVYEEFGALVYSRDVVEALFPEGMIEQMFTSYGQLLQKLLTEPDCWHEPTVVELPEF
ncbi:MAG: AMP-binding protein, partial [Methylococcales bacterium]|nr:AMP-binding protein [Methylococcales bacterium]